MQLRQAAQRVGEAYRAEEQEARAAGAALAYGAPHMELKVGISICVYMPL